VKIRNKGYFAVRGALYAMTQAAGDPEFHS
jgi:hypothetical protein